MAPTLPPPQNANTSVAQLWHKPLANGDVAVVLFNRGERPLPGWKFAFADVGLTKKGSASVRDLWAHTDNGTHIAGGGEQGGLS